MIPTTSSGTYAMCTQMMYRLQQIYSMGTLTTRSHLQLLSHWPLHLTLQ